MTEHHAWMPSSPCGDECVDGQRPVGNATVAVRATAVAALLASFPVVNYATPTGWRDGVQRRYAEALLRTLGMKLRIVDNRGTGKREYSDSGVLIVAGHVGWTDILALASVQPLAFVARADLVSWPLLGKLAKLMRTIPIERASLRQLPDVVDEIATRIAAGERIAAFPEGTTWCGRAYGGLRPAMFQAAIDAGVPVQPVQVRYLGPDGLQSTFPSFIGTESMGQSVLRMLRGRATVIEVVLAPAELPGTDRRELAARCERAVRGDIVLDFADHGVLEVPAEPAERVVARIA